MVFLRPVVVRSKEASTGITMDRYDYMRAAGELQSPTTGEPLLRNLGAPVLPQLTSGQPPVGGNMVPQPPQPVPAANGKHGTKSAQPGTGSPGAVVGGGAAQKAAPPTQG
jgi:general secretion pathway protein D